MIGKGPDDAIRERLTVPAFSCGRQRARSDRQARAAMPCWPARSECHQCDLWMAKRKALEVLGIARCDERKFEFEGSGNNEGIDGICRRHPCDSKQGAGALGDLSGQFDNPDGFPVQELVDGSVQPTAATNLSENRRRDSDKHPALMGDPGDSSCSQRECAAFGRICKRVQSLRIQNQRFGQARLALRRTDSGTGPRVSSSSSRNWPSA